MNLLFLLDKNNDNRSRVIDDIYMCVLHTYCTYTEKRNVFPGPVTCH